MTRGLTIAEAASELRKTSRWLKEWLGKHPVDAAGIPFYVPLGRTKTFEAADIARMKTAIEVTESLQNNGEESVVYFIAVRGFIKIGWTTAWKKRFIGLQTSNPEPIEVLLIVGRPRIYEKTMHTKFAQFRAMGEWFKDVPELRSHIASLTGECWYRAGRFR